MLKWIVVVDYGLNGAGVIPRLFATEEAAKAYAETWATTKLPNQPYPPSSVTGYGGWEAVKIDTDPEV